MIDFEKLAERMDQARAEEYERASPEERARIDAARREQEIDRARPRARVRAIRRDCFTGEESDVEIVLVARPGSRHEIWVYIEEGGSTGYESIPLAKVDEAIVQGKGWAACFGTAGRWDGLTVPVESLREARVVLGGAS